MQAVTAAGLFSNLCRCFLLLLTSARDHAQMIERLCSSVHPDLEPTKGLDDRGCARYRYGYLATYVSQGTYLSTLL